jgi:gas vesicle protein
MTTDDMLARLGLQTKTTTADFLLPALGVFSVGALVGAGVALLVAPKAGNEVRQDIRRTAAKLSARVRRNRDDLMDMTRDEIYAQAQDLEIDGRSDMTKSELADAVRAVSQAVS